MMHFRINQDEFSKRWAECLNAPRKQKTSHLPNGFEGNARIQSGEMPESLTESTAENTNTSPKKNFSDSTDLEDESVPDPIPCAIDEKAAQIKTRSQEVIDAKANAYADYIFEQLRIIFAMAPFSNANNGKGWRPPSKLKAEQLEKLRVVVKGMRTEAKNKALDPALQKFKSTWGQAIMRTGDINTKHPGLDMIIDFAHAIAEHEIERMERNKILRLNPIDSGDGNDVDFDQLPTTPGYISPTAENGYWYEVQADGTKRHHFENIKGM
jgi:hypothetical protein